MTHLTFLAISTNLVKGGHKMTEYLNLSQGLTGFPCGQHNFNRHVNEQI